MKSVRLLPIKNFIAFVFLALAISACSMKGGVTKISSKRNLIQDEPVSPSLSIADVTVSEAAGTATFTITLSTKSKQSVTVDWATANGTAASGSDYTAGSGTATIAAGSTSTTFTVAVAQDPLDEIDETFDVIIGSTANLTIADTAATGTITDDDATPSVQFSVATQSLTEAVGTVTVQANLSVVSGQQVTVPYTISGTANGSGTDHNFANGTLTIATGSSNTTTTFTVTDDALDEADETVIATIGTPTNSTVGTNGIQTITIQDNDANPTLSIADMTVGEAAGTATFTVSLSAVSGQDVVFDWATSNGTATAGSDYTAGSATAVTIAAGATTSTFTVAVIQDALDESNETYVVTLSNALNASIADATATGTITDDDATPSVQFNVATQSVSESTGTVTVQADLSAVSGRDVTIPYTVSGTSSGSGTDHNLGNGTLTIAAGSSNTTTTFTITDDSLDENNETVIATIGSPTNATVGTNDVQTITITDDDATPSLSIADVTLAEGDGTVTFTVSLSAASGQDVVFDWATSNGTATAGSDYTAGSATAVTIAAGATTSTFTVALTQDAVDEANETYNVTLGNAVNATFSDNVAVGAITDDDATPSLSIADVTLAEGDGTVTFTVSLSAASGQDVVFDWATSNGTATAGSDYTAGSATAVTIAAGATTSTFTVAVTQDALDESNETYVVTLSNAVNASISDATATGTITDDDATPSLSIADVTLAEGDGTVTFTVSLSAASGQDVVFDWATSNGTATAGSDYTAGSATAVTIAAGATTSTFTVAVTQDAVDESNETYVVTLSNAVNASIADATATGTITDDDATPSLSIADATLAEGGGTATFTVSLSAASGQDVVFDWATSNGTATAGSDYTAGSATAVTIAAGATTSTFTVAVTQDAVDEANETYVVTLSNAVNASIADATATGTITDDDATPSLSIADATLAEGGGTATFTVSLSAASGQDVVFDWATSNGTATAGSDYTAGSATAVTIAAGATTSTFTVAVTQDALDESNETYVVTLSNAVSASISDATATGTITDDDATPSLSIADATLAEGGGTVTLTVSLSAASGQDVVFDWATSNGTATAGSDYTAGSATAVTIAAGATTSTFTVAVTQDALDEANETYVVTLSNAVNASIADATATGTITDDDATPTLSIADVTVGEAAGSVTFTVTLSAASGQNVIYDWATSDGTATAGLDYTSGSATAVTITAGATTSTLTVAITQEAVEELSETFDVNLTNAVNATISDATALGTITDDDAIAPTITSLSAPANGSYKQSANLDFTANFSENVTVTSTPRVILDIGGTTKYANYLSGSGTAALVFRYAVEAAMNDADGISVSTLSLNGGAIIDLIGNAANLSFTPPNTGAVLVDTTSPSVQSTTGPANGTYLLGQYLSFALTFNESVNVTGTPRLTLTIGSTTRYADYLSGTGTSVINFRYTVQAGDSDSNGIAVAATIDLNSGTLSDAATNSASLGFTAPNTAGVNVQECPTNYVLIAALSPYTTSPFCVAKYEMKNVSGVATSSPNGTPWDNITRNSSITECSELGTGYALISNAQWQTIARNLEGVGFNWSGGTVGNAGGMSRGHSDSSPNSPLSASGDDNDSCSGTGQTCSLSTWNDQRRVHQLASGSYIWDIAGNVWEWVIDDNSTNFGSDSYMSTVTTANHPATGSIGGVSGNAKYHFGPAGDYTGLSTSPYGSLGYGYLNYTGGAVLRGGNWNDGPGDGAFAVDLIHDPTPYAAASNGFRCVYSP